MSAEKQGKDGLEGNSQDWKTGADDGNIHLDSAPDGASRGCPADIGVFTSGMDGSHADYRCGSSENPDEENETKSNSLLACDL